MTTTSVGRPQAEATPRAARYQGWRILVSAAAVGVTLTVGVAAPASAATPASTASTTVVTANASCTGIYGQPTLPILCKNAPAYVPVPQSNGSIPWAALRGCVTNYQAGKDAIRDLARVHPAAQKIMLAVVGGYCIYSVGAGD